MNPAMKTVRSKAAYYTTLSSIHTLFFIPEIYIRLPTRGPYVYKQYGQVVQGSIRFPV